MASTLMSVKTKTALQLRQLTKEEIPLVNRFYKAAHSPHRAGKHEPVIIAQWLLDNGEKQIIGAVRIRRFAPHQLLTGLIVTPAFRHLGIATKLITTMHEQHGDSPLFAFIEPQLMALYQRCGYQPLLPEELPSQLLTNFIAYRRTSAELIALIYGC